MGFKLKGLFRSFALSAIGISILFAGYTLMELYSAHILRKEGWLPPHGQSLNEQGYRYQINGFTVRANTPNYRSDGYDENFVWHKDSLLTDKNGFVTGGLDLVEMKDSGVTRIFLTGGSAAWGSLQTGHLMDSVSYPEGNYIYEASIAGQLQKILKTRHPAKKFEVINAAVVGFTLAQDKAFYEYSLRNFKPDIIINLDGNNDKVTFSSPTSNGNPYLASNQQFEEDLQLYALSHSINTPNTFMLFNLRHFEKRKREQSQELLKMLPPDFKPSSNTDNIATEPDSAIYKLMEPIFIKNADNLLWLINAYLNQLQADNVHSIFCMQPLLSRRIEQKHLSPLELKMRQHFEEIKASDTFMLHAILPYIKKAAPSYYTTPLLKLGKQKYEIATYCESFFIGSYLTPKIDSIAKTHGQSFIDVSKYMTAEGTDKEFYTDYCHLTPYGNKFIANLLANEVDKIINQNAAKTASGN